MPDDPEALLSRKALADALTAAGFKTAESTLATLATRGGGPKFRKFGRFPLYPWGEGLQWARSRLTPLVGSTSELDVKAA